MSLIYKLNFKFILCTFSDKRFQNLIIADHISTIQELILSLLIRQYIEGARTPLLNNNQTTNAIAFPHNAKQSMLNFYVYT